MILDEFRDLNGLIPTSYELVMNFTRFIPIKPIKENYSTLVKQFKNNL
jgi:hypothetical protein